MSTKPSDSLQHIQFEGCDVCVIAPEDYDDTLDRLATRCAALERDAARYRFLRDRDGMGNVFMHTPTNQLDATIDREIAADEEKT